MHIQIINFSLKGINEEAYRQQVDAVAPVFADLPGLLSKTWLANKETNTYGGVYVWRDREARKPTPRRTSSRPWRPTRISRTSP
jgi:hypothetical protein